MQILFQINKVISNENSEVISESNVEAESAFYEGKRTFKVIYDGGDFESIFSKQKYSQMGIGNISAIQLQSSQDLYIKTMSSDEVGLLCKYMLFTGSVDNIWAKNDSGTDAEITITVWGE